MDDESRELLPISTGKEKALDVLSMVSSYAPWLGGPVSSVLSGMSISRKIGRVGEVLDNIAQEFKDFKSEVSETYVKTDDFAELLERTLRQAADERNEEKRRAYAAFLANDIKNPGSSYDDKVRILRTLEDLRPDHMRILKALVAEPDPNPGMIGSVGRTLSNRVSGISPDKIRELAQELTDMRLAKLNDLGVTMTGQGAEQLQDMITTYGSSVLKYLESEV